MAAGITEATKNNSYLVGNSRDKMTDFLTIVNE